MDLRDYLTIFAKNWILILGCCVIGLAFGLGYTLLAPPNYRATTQVVVSTQQSGNASTDELLQGSSYSRNQVTTYVQLVTQPLILDPVIEKLGLNESAQDLAKQVNASSPTNTTIINVTVTARDSASASAIANAIGESMKKTIQDMETPAGSTDSRVKLTTSSPATPPVAPAAPRMGLDLALGLIAGLVIGALAAIARTLLDTGIREPKDIEKLTQSSVIGLVPETTNTDSDPLVMHSASTSPRSEAFRKLRTNLRFVDFENTPKSIVITSSVPGEAKTTTSINLAYTLAASGMRVCLVEADLRRPKLGAYLGLEDSVGLTSVLIGRVNLAGALQPFGGVPTLHVMTCGEVPPNPAEWLGSATMARLVKSLEQQYDMVVLDSPPLLPVTDAAVLSGMVGGTLMVVGCGKVKQVEVERSLEALKTVDAKLLGVVMTFVKHRRLDAYGAGYNYTYEPVG